MRLKSNCANSPCRLERYWNFGVFSPCAMKGCAAPRASSISSVGGWKVEARDSSLRACPASNTVTGTLLRTRLAAATRPTGPAPTMSTRSWVTRLLNDRDAGLGDDSAPLHCFGKDEFCQFSRRRDSRFRALFDDFGTHSRIGCGGIKLTMKLGKDRLWRRAWGQERQPSGCLVVLN